MNEIAPTPPIEIADTVRWLERAVIGLNPVSYTHLTLPTTSRV